MMISAVLFVQGLLPRESFQKIYRHPFVLLSDKLQAFNRLSKGYGAHAWHRLRTAGIPSAARASRGRDGPWELLGVFNVFSWDSSGGVLNWGHPNSWIIVNGKSY